MSLFSVFSLREVGKQTDSGWGALLSGFVAFGDNAPPAASAKIHPTDRPRLSKGLWHQGVQSCISLFS